MSLPIVYKCKRGKQIKVVRVDIGLMGPEEVRKMSVVEVTESTTHEKNVAKRNGLNDHRMGPTDRRIPCGTCGHKIDRCPGHFGHIELAYPCYHAGFINMILKILRCVCFFCSRLRVDVEDSRVKKIVKSSDKRDRLVALVKLSKTKKVCIHRDCSGKQPEYERSKKNPLIIEVNWEDSKMETAEDIANSEKPFTSKEVQNILKHVPDSDYRIMGFNPIRSHPSWMVMDVLSVPPPVLRPSIMEAEGSKTKGHDDLTHKLKEIVEANKAIRKWYSGEGSSSSSDPPLQKLIDNLQMHVATYIDNDIKGQKQSVQRSGAPTKSVISRFRGGKENRLRG